MRCEALKPADLSGLFLWHDVSDDVLACCPHLFPRPVPHNSSPASPSRPSSFNASSTLVRSAGRCQSSSDFCSPFSRSLAGRIDRLSRHRIDATVEHAGRNRAGCGRKVLNLLNLHPHRLSVSASSSMSANVQPGCPEIRYGTIVCRLPSRSLSSRKRARNFSKLFLPGLRIRSVTCSTRCSGAILSRPLT